MGDVDLPAPAVELRAVTKRFRAGEIDFQDDFASEQIDFLRKELPAETHIAPYIGTYYYVVNFNRKPFDDPRVRKALSLAIERDAITDKVLKTGEVPAYGVVPPGTGTPICGGLTTATALAILRGLTGLAFVGMDVVEVAPAYDVGGITALAAASLALLIGAEFALHDVFAEGAGPAGVATAGPVAGHIYG